MLRKYTDRALCAVTDNVFRLYHIGGSYLTCAMAVCAAACILLKFWLKKLNRQAELRDAESNTSLNTFRYVT